MPRPASSGVLVGLGEQVARRAIKRESSRKPIDATPLGSRVITSPCPLGSIARTSLVTTSKQYSRPLPPRRFAHDQAGHQYPYFCHSVVLLADETSAACRNRHQRWRTSDSWRNLVRGGEPVANSRTAAAIGDRDEPPHRVGPRRTPSRDHRARVPGTRAGHSHRPVV